MKVFAIVVTYNGLDWYNKCFSSLKNSTIPLNIIAIDNCSQDNSEEYLKKNFPENALIKLNENIGFGQANNVGIWHALHNNAEYIFLLNQDAWVESNTIEQLINYHKFNKNYGILSPLHLNPKDNRIEKGFLEHLILDKVFLKNSLDDLIFQKVKDIYSVDFVNAAAWLVPREIFEIVGGFDPIFFHYGEDNNFVHRLKFHKYQVALCPKLKIFHDRDIDKNRLNTNQIKKNRHINLLLRFSDINNSESIFLFIISSGFKMLMKLLKLNFNSSAIHLSMLSFILLNRKKIKTSRKHNISGMYIWLNHESKDFNKKNN